MSDPTTMALSMDEIALAVIGDVFDWRQRFGDEAKTHLWTMRMPDTADRMSGLMIQHLHMVYGTRSDYGRDAIWYFTYFHYKKNQMHDPEIASLLAQSKAAGNAAWTAKIRRQIRTHCDDMHDSLLDAFCDGNLEECYRQIEQFWAVVAEIPNLWVREKYLAAVENSALLRTVTGTLKRMGYKVDGKLLVMYT